MDKSSPSDNSKELRGRASTIYVISAWLFVSLAGLVIASVAIMAWVATLVPPGPASLTPGLRLDFPSTVPVSGPVAKEAVGTWYIAPSRGGNVRLQLRSDGTYWQ